jgi:hypothetical protein
MPLRTVDDHKVIEDQKKKGGARQKDWGAKDVECDMS